MLSASWVKSAVIVLMVVTLFVLFQYPLKRLKSDSEVNFNEGWNAYRQQYARQGVPLYSSPPELTHGATTYPPVSFHLVGLLSGHGDVVRTGRWVSIFALLITGLFVGMIVRELGADPVIAAFSTLLYILGIAVFLTDRVGMDDPQLLGEAFTTAGLYFYIKGPARVRWLCASALAFCLGGFTKQNLLAFPAAVALDLLIKSRKKFAVWMAAMVVFAGLFTLLTFALDGRYLFAHLLQYRGYSFEAAVGTLTHFYLMTFQGVLLVAMVWLLCRFRTQPLLTAAFVFSTVLAVALSGGDGVDLNIYFNAFAATVIVCGVAIAEIEQWRVPAQSLSQDEPSPRPDNRSFGPAIAGALMLTLFLCALIRFPDRFREGRYRSLQLADDDAGFHAAVDLIKSRPGPALCESLLVCYDAGKPYSYDSYTEIVEIKSHHVDEEPVLRLIRNRYFAVVQLDAIAGEATTEPVTIFRSRSRFTTAFVDALTENYRLTLRTSHMLLFVPK